MTPLLDVRDLRVSFKTAAGIVPAVDGLSYTVREGERLAIVGESGSGKTVSALSILGLTSGTVEGQVLFQGVDLVRMGDAGLRQVRGGQIGVVFQDPMSSLNPLMSIGDHVTEALVIRGASRSVARRRAVDLLGRVGIKNAANRLDDYPHQFSGGMRQRVAIAAALITDPKLIIADEPTTALDVRVQAQVLDLLRSLSAERGLAVILITHDVAIVPGFADRAIVMYAGLAAEEASTTALFYAGVHPYTWGLLGAAPLMSGEIPARLTAIPGQPPSLGARPDGCPFHPRCSFATDRCATDRPSLDQIGDEDHRAACHYAGSLPRPDRMRRVPG